MLIVNQLKSEIYICIYNAEESVSISLNRIFMFAEVEAERCKLEVTTYKAGWDTFEEKSFGQLRVKGHVLG